MLQPEGATFNSELRQEQSEDASSIRYPAPITTENSYVE